MGEALLEVHLEELGQRSWMAALANTLLGTTGSAQFRFAARYGSPLTPPGMDATDGRGSEAPCTVGETFPMMRWQDLNDRREPNAWLETALERLEALDEELERQGWSRLEDTGRHWWSRRYVREVARTHA